MSRNALAFVAGLGTGYLSQSERNKDRERQDRRDKREDEDHQAKVDERNRVKAGRDALSNAAKDLTVEPVQPTTPNDDEGNAMPTAGFKAGTQVYATQAEATKAATDPSARNKRVLAAQTQIDPAKGIQLEGSMKQAEAADIQLADQKWRRDLGTAMRGGHESLAQLINKSESGVMAGAKLRIDVSQDGKTATYSKQDEKGNLVPGMTFPNNEEGVARAAFMLDRAVKPEDRLDYFTKAKKASQDQANSDRDFNLRKAENESQADYRKRMLGIQESQNKRAAELHRLTTAAEFKFPPAVKLRADGLRKELETIGSAQAKAQAENSYDPSSQNALALAQRQVAINKQMEELLKPYMKDFEGAGADPMGVMGKTPAAAAPASSGASAAPAPAAQAARPPAAATAGTMPAAQANAPDRFEKMRADNIAAITPDVMALKQAQQQLVAVARSGDPVALKAATANVMAVRTAVLKNATAKFGDKAGQIVDQILAQ
jgi:hypothetical protein